MTTQNVTKKFGMRVRELRSEAGLTQEHLAETAELDCRARPQLRWKRREGRAKPKYRECLPTRNSNRRLSC